jgi:hypothetical protein
VVDDVIDEGGGARGVRKDREPAAEGEIGPDECVRVRAGLAQPVAAVSLMRVPLLLD